MFNDAARRADPRRRWRSRSCSACSRSRCSTRYLVTARLPARRARGRTARSASSQRAIAERVAPSRWCRREPTPGATSIAGYASDGVATRWRTSSWIVRAPTRRGRRVLRVTTVAAASAVAASRRSASASVALRRSSRSLLSSARSRSGCSSSAAEQRRVLRTGLARRSHDRDARRRPRASASAARSCPARIERRRRRRRLRAHRRRRDACACAHHGSHARRCSRTARPSSPKGTGRASTTFVSDQLLIKHGTDYEPPKVDDGRAVPGRARQGDPMKAPARLRRCSPSAPPRAVLGIATLGAGLAPARPRAAAHRAALRVRRARRRGRRVRRRWSGRCSRHDFSIRYVAENNVARATPGALHVHRGCGPRSRARSCCGRSSSAATSRSRRGGSAPAPTTRSSRGRRIIGLVVALFFFALMLGPANPFQVIAGAIPLDGRGPEPAAAEPPAHGVPPADALPRATSGFTIPFSFAIAALVTGRFGEGWLADARRTTLVAWGFLTVGIVLGAWWSYEVLGWGGYWGWDPVENASLLPWLTAHRVHPLGDGAGTARDAARLEPVARASRRSASRSSARSSPARASSTRCTRSRSRRSGRGC